MNNFLYIRPPVIFLWLKIYPHYYGMQFLYQFLILNIFKLKTPILTLFIIKLIASMTEVATINRPIDKYNRIGI